MEPVSNGNVQMWQDLSDLTLWGIERIGGVPICEACGEDMS